MYNNEPKLVLGIGTGRCGTRSLRELFFKQDLMKHSNTYTNKMKHCIHEGSIHIDHNKNFFIEDSEKIEKYVTEYLNTTIRKCGNYIWPKKYEGLVLDDDPDEEINHHVNIGFNLLNYVEEFLKQYKHTYVIALKRPDKDSFVNSVWKNYYENGMGSFFVKYFLTQCMKEAEYEVKTFWGDYWEKYNAKIDELVSKYPDRIRSYNYLDVMNNKEVQKEMFTFCGVKYPYLTTNINIGSK